MDYSQAYRIDSLQSVGVDDAYNIWLLDGPRIGVLRPGSAAPVWTSDIGQAGRGFASTVICGGAADTAYVGYMTDDIADPVHATPEQMMQGDADIVKVDRHGTISLDQHMKIVNTNDPTIDETRSILSCAKVMRGAQRGDVYFGTNHAVTRVRGDHYADHRHAVFDEPAGSGHLVIGYNWGVSITRDGDVFLGNEYKFGIIRPGQELTSFLDYGASPWIIDDWVEAMGPQRFSSPQMWHATAQRINGDNYLGSWGNGAWKVQLSPRSYTKVTGLPTEQVTALAATDDGSVFIGTKDQGLWRLDANDTLMQVGVQASRVQQLVYDPTVAPSMLYAVTDRGLWVLRGF